jgi:hypothetical protein
MPTAVTMNRSNRCTDMQDNEIVSITIVVVNSQPIVNMSQWPCHRKG